MTLKWKYEKLAVVVRGPQTKQKLVISHSCLAGDGKEMKKDLQDTSDAIVLLINPSTPKQAYRRT